MNFFYVLRKNNQRICINPHTQIIFSNGALVRATNFSICQNNKKGKDPSKKLDFTDVVYKKVLKMEIFNSIFVDMVFNNLEFVSLLEFDNFCNDFKLLFHKLSENKIPFSTEDM